jgi:tRNA G46 methylase TrmB
MQILHKEFSDVSRYIQNNCHLTLEEHQPKFEDYLRRVNRFRRVDSSAAILEIGIGTGWFPFLCRAKTVREDTCCASFEMAGFEGRPATCQV